MKILLIKLKKEVQMNISKHTISDNNYTPISYNQIKEIINNKK